MRILITGGAGFIGSHLVDFHLRRGDRVVAVDDLSTGSAANVRQHADNPSFRFVHADLLTWNGLEAAVAEADRIYNMAAVVGMFRVLQQPVETTRVNTFGCERVLHAVVAAGHKPQVVQPSSSSVYGPARYEDLHEDAPITVSPDAPLMQYALSKFSNEAQGRAYHEKHGISIVIARLFNTAGLRQAGLYGYVLPRFVQQAIAGEPLTVFGDGMQTRSFCDVRDTVAMLDRLAATPAAWGKVVNVGNAQEIRILDLANMVRARTGSDSPVTFVSYEQAYGKSFTQIPQRRPILTRLHELIGYRHDWPLESTVDWLHEHYRSAAQHANALNLAQPQWHLVPPRPTMAPLGTSPQLSAVG